MEQPERLLRIWQICGCKKRGITPLIDISKSKWWDGVAKKDFPAGILISPRCRVWTLSSIQKLISDLAAAGGAR
jgi:predicted DNA-binding transcriptional regulator AlpA